MKLKRNVMIGAALVTALTALGVAQHAIETMVDAIRTNRDGALQTWSRTCDLYARYFSALAKAQGPEGVLAANADFMSGGLEVLGARDDQVSIT